MLFPVQHMDMLAYFDIAVTFDAIMAVGTRQLTGPVIHIFTFVTTSQRETHA